MKITLKGLFIASLSAVCLLAHNQANAMNREQEDFTPKSVLNNSTLTQSTVFGQSGLGQSSNFDQLNISVTELYNFFGEEKAQEFLKKSLSMSGLSASSIKKVITPEEREFIILQSKDNPLFPELQFAQMADLIYFLHSKYSIFCHESDLVLPECQFDKKYLPKITKFLDLNKKTLDILADPSAMILALKMLQNFDSQEYLAPHNHYGTPIPTYNKPLLAHFGGVHLTGEFQAKLSMKLDEVYKTWEWGIQRIYWGMPMGMNGLPVTEEQHKNTMKDRLKKELNKLLSMSNHLNDISVDFEMINITVQSWYNIGRQLAIFELKQCEPLEIVLAGLQKDYHTVEGQLMQAAQSESNLFLAGVHKSAYGISIGEVSKKELADDVSWLRNKVSQHKEADKEKLHRNSEIQKYITHLRTLVNWFDDVFSTVSKTGQIT